MINDKSMSLIPKLENSVKQKEMNYREKCVEPIAILVFCHCK